MVSTLPQETKHYIDFNYPWGGNCTKCDKKKYNWFLSQVGSFFLNISILQTKLEHWKDHVKINFEIFQTQFQMRLIVRTQE